MTDNTQPEALDLADWLEAVGGGGLSPNRCAALLREQHARIAELESQLAQRFDAADMATASAQGFRDGATAQAQPVAEQGVAYAALPTSNYAGRVYEEGFLIGTCPLYTTDQLHAFADATHTLRASHGQAPAGAGMGHTDGGRNMFYEGRFDGESQREQQARLRWANDMRAAFERHTGNGWFDKDWRTETGLWSSAWHACLAAQPTTTAQPDSVQEDAARYRWLAASCRSTSEHWGGRWSIIIDGPAPKSHDSEDDFDAAVDAARKQGVKQ